MDAKTNVIYRAKHLDVSNLTQSQAASEHLSKAILGSEDISAGRSMKLRHCSQRTLLPLTTTRVAASANNSDPLCLKLPMEQLVNCV